MKYHLLFYVSGLFRSTCRFSLFVLSWTTRALLHVGSRVTIFARFIQLLLILSYSCCIFITCKAGLILVSTLVLFCRILFLIEKLVTKIREEELNWAPWAPCNEMGWLFGLSVLKLIMPSGCFFAASLLWTQLDHLQVVLPYICEEWSSYTSIWRPGFANGLLDWASWARCYVMKRLLHFSTLSVSGHRLQSLL